MNLILDYVRNMLIYAIVLLPIYIIGRFLYIKRKGRKIDWKREGILTIFSLYNIALASQTIIPNWNAGIETDTGDPFIEFSLVNDLSHLNFIPFHTIYDFSFNSNPGVDEWSSVVLVNLVGNLVMFIPIGFLAPIIWKRLNCFRNTLILGLSVTCFIEFVQYFIGRSSDIDDVFLNTIGVLMGYYIFSFFYFLLKKPILKKEKL